MIAIVGSGGYIASRLIKQIAKDKGPQSILRIDRTDTEGTVFLDLRTPEAFDYHVLKGVNTIVFTAAVSSPDACASQYDESYAINVSGTLFFIERALSMGIRTLFFSSDAVFGNAPNAIFNEISNTLPDTPYGQMKKAIEDHFADDMRFKAIRLSYVVSARDRFVSYCLNCMRDGNVADIFHPFYRNCIILSDVIDAVCYLLENWEAFIPRFLNIAGDELVSRVRIADEINRLADGALAYTISRPDQAFYANRAPIVQMESLYRDVYHTHTKGNFSAKIQKELGGSL